MISFPSKSSLPTSLRNLIGTTLSLVLIVTGCNLPSRSVESTQSEIPTPAAPLPSPTPAEPVQSRSLDQALMDGVEDGSWTFEEGILTGLRFLAGEVTSDGVFGDTLLMSTEGTGVIDTAQRYLIDGTDETAKVEIQRYLDMLMPSPEILDQISQPAPQSNATMHLARIVNSTNEQDRILCQTLWAHSFRELHNPEGTLIPYDCLLRVESTMLGTNVRLYYPADWSADDPRLNKVDIIMDAARSSLQKYNPYGPNPINTVYMVMTDYAYYSNREGSFIPTIFAAASHFSSPTTSCHVGIFPFGIEGSTESLQQTIAHEMFHCYQYKNLGPQMFGPRNEEFYNARKWWSEGSAEFFGATVYPENNDEFIFNGDFQANSFHEPLMGMEYENYLFFQYLAREGGLGPEGVIDILRHMPDDGGSDEQQDALANVNGINDLFHNFARAYMDRRLTDMNGSELNIEPYIFDYRSFGEGFHGELFEPRSFVVGLYNVVFADQTKFTNTAEEEGKSGKYAIRPEEFVGAWQPVPPRINTVCDPPEYVMVVTSALSSNAEPYQVAVNATGEHQEDNVCDECLYGTWELDNNSDYFYMYTLVGNMLELLPSLDLDTDGANAYLKSLSGQMRLNFTEDGQANGTQTDYSWTVEAVKLEDNRKVSMSSTFNGGGSANYIIRETPEEEKWIFFNNGLFDISNEVTFMGRHVTTVPTGGSNTSVFLSSPVRYECSEGTLLYTTMPDIGTLIFFRVDPPSGSP
jgi:hypothetical protein